MAAILDWHGHARCLRDDTECDWEFDVINRTSALDVDDEAARHERKFRHPVTRSLHRIDYCEQLGCKPLSLPVGQ